MEKVKITQEQANAIENLKSFWIDKREEERNLILIKEKLDPNYKWHDSDLIAANEIPDDDFIAALHRPYEVEPEYPKFGDWVKYDTGSAIIYGQIDTTPFDDVIGNFSNGQRQRFHKSSVSFMTESEIAEEKERRFFARHDRQPWDLRQGDLLSEKVTERIYEVFSELRDEFSIDLKSAETIDAYHIENIKQDFEVASFVDGRLDVKSDE